MSNPKKQMRKKKELQFDPETGLRIYEGKELHFNDYLRQQVGAGWYMLRDTLYDAEYEAMDVFTYREGLLRDFWALCKKKKLTPIIYK